MHKKATQQNTSTLEAEFRASYHPVDSFHMSFSAIAWSSSDGRFYAMREYWDDSLWVLVLREGALVFPSAAAARAFACQSHYSCEVFLMRVPDGSMAVDRGQSPLRAKRQAPSAKRQAPTSGRQKAVGEEEVA